MERWEGGGGRGWGWGWVGVARIRIQTRSLYIHGRLHCLRNHHAHCYFEQAVRAKFADILPCLRMLCMICSETCSCVEYFHYNTT